MGPRSAKGRQQRAKGIPPSPGRTVAEK